MKKLTCLLLAALMVLSMAACGAPKEKQFTADEMRLTLAGNFKESKADGYTAAFESPSIVVLVLRENKSAIRALMGGDITMERYEQCVIDANASRGNVQMKTEGGVRFFEYDFKSPQNNNIYSYFNITKESGQAFWLVQFFCLQSQYQKYKPDFLKYAAGISFDESAAPEGSGSGQVRETMKYTVRELTLTFPNNFRPGVVPGYSGVCTADDLSAYVTMLRENKEFVKLVAETDKISLDDFIGLVRDVNQNMNPSEIQTTGGVKYFSYTAADANGSRNTHFITVIETAKAFWTLDMFCPEAAFEAKKTDFARWAASASVNEKNVANATMYKYAIDEMDLYLPSEFEEDQPDPDYEDAAFVSEYADVYVTRCEKTQSYKDFWSDLKEHYKSVAPKEGSWNKTKYFVYTDEYDGGTFETYVTVLESDKAFWILEYMCDSPLSTELQPEFELWTKTVSFNK